MKASILVSCVLVVASTISVPGDKTPIASEEEVTRAYDYLLARWLTLRQESADLNGKFQWNKFIHRAPGEATWAAPDPRVLFSEAWIYVDATACAVLSLPEIKSRYYTVQVFNGWGELTGEINAYRYPQQPFGRFAFCLQRTHVTLEGDIQRISLPSKKSRVLLRIEMGTRPQEAVALQKKVTLRATGSSKVEPAPIDFAGDNAALPGVQIFDKVEDLLASEIDIGKDSQPMQQFARAAGVAAADPEQREHVEAIIREKAIPQFLAAIGEMGPKINGWVYPRRIGRYGDDYMMRSIAEFTGLWSGDGKQAIYFGTEGLNGSDAYTQTFPKEAPPIRNARYQWSLVVLDGERFRIPDSPRERHMLEKGPRLKYNSDGSLTLAFAPERPRNAPESNWLPTPTGKKYTVIYRIAGTPVLAADPYYPPEPVKN